MYTSVKSEVKQLLTIVTNNMAFIYKITNKVNGKVYIGKTEETVEKRFKQHLSEYLKERSKNRPLYRAIQKYGKENFEVCTLEETNNSSEREIFWIEFYSSYSNGYNATKGGDGSSYVDENLILSELLANNLNCNKTAKILNLDNKTVIRIAKKFNTYKKVVQTAENQPHSVITKELALKIKQMYVPKVFGSRKIAKILNLPRSAVDNVVRGLSWANVESV